MVNSLAIMAATLEGRVAKYATFQTEPEANAHVARFTDKFPKAFTVPEPAAPWLHWLIDMDAGTLAVDPPPPPDYATIDQATVDRLLLESGVMRALAQALFNVNNRVRALEGRGAITATEYKTYLKGLIRS